MPCIPWLLEELSMPPAICFLYAYEASHYDAKSLKLCMVTLANYVIARWTAVASQEGGSIQSRIDLD